MNGVLPTLRAGPFHLLGLLLELRCDVLKAVTVTFPLVHFQPELNVVHD